MSVYDFTVKNASGGDVSMSEFAGKVLLIVNTASKCGNTPQYEGLEKLQQQYADQGFSVIGFPCNQFGSQEPGSNEDIQEFCSINYHTTFPVMAKIDVNGTDADPLYRYMKKEQRGADGSTIEWNFAKFLIDRDGNVVKRYIPKAQPEDVAPDIEALLV
ncbi:MAG: glutathione peroxidase [Thermomicrobiales bacterium]|nr:glutathione peroxidase [Thermomicrobiales bacterium]